MRFDLDQAIEILEATPNTLRSLLSGLSDEWLTGNEGGESWSPFEVVGHLLHAEHDDWIPRAHVILAGEGTFKPFDRFFHLTAYADDSLGELLDAFEAARRESVAELRRLELTEERLDSPGHHPDLGDVTLRQLLATWVVHDLGHLGQISRVLAKQYADEVGPWAEYLPVLGDR